MSGFVFILNESENHRLKDSCVNDFATLLETDVSVRQSIGPLNPLKVIVIRHTGRRSTP